jgi:hypothetical protein
MAVAVWKVVSALKLYSGVLQSSGVSKGGRQAE